jgi:hypothetical protein
MGLAFQCDNMTCKKFLIAGKDLIFIFMRNNETKHICLECMVLMKNEKEKSGTGNFDPNKLSLFDYPEYRSNE